MAKLLKLDAIGSYVGPRTENTLITKGQVVRVDDDVADKMLEGFEIELGGDGNRKYHWTEQPEGTKYHYDFSGGSVKIGNAGKDDPDSGDPEVADEAAKEKPAPQRQVAKRAAPQRKQTARPAAKK